MFPAAIRLYVAKVAITSGEVMEKAVAMIKKETMETAGVEMLLRQEILQIFIVHLNTIISRSTLYLNSL